MQMQHTVQTSAVGPASSCPGPVYLCVPILYPIPHARQCATRLRRGLAAVCPGELSQEAICAISLPRPSVLCTLCLVPRSGSPPRLLAACHTSAVVYQNTAAGDRLQDTSTPHPTARRAPPAGTACSPPRFPCIHPICIRDSVRGDGSPGAAVIIELCFYQIVKGAKGAKGGPQATGVGEKEEGGFCYFRFSRTTRRAVGPQRPNNLIFHQIPPKAPNLSFPNGPKAILHSRVGPLPPARWQVP